MERITIQVGEQETSAVLEGGGDTGILLAHGAGAGQDSDWMQFFRTGLAGRGFLIMTFDYLYLAAGRKRPDQLPRLLACHRAAAAELAARSPRVVLAGKSMGGRVGGHLAAEDREAAGVVFFGYPLVPIGKAEPRDTSHLHGLSAPILFVAGTRDRMGPLHLIEAVAGKAQASLAVIEDGDHSLKVRKRSGRTSEEAWSEAVDVTARWIEDSVSSQG